MELDANQVSALKKVVDRELETFVENGCRYISVSKLSLPEGCEPQEIDALLCISPRDGYPSRLFLAAKIQCRENRNWNAMDVRINGRNWFAVSWTVNEGETLINLLSMHLKAFK